MGSLTNESFRNIHERLSHLVGSFTFSCADLFFFYLILRYPSPSLKRVDLVHRSLGRHFHFISIAVEVCFNAFIDDTTEQTGFQ